MLRSLDVLISMMSQVKLKKDNQLVLMQGIKVFLSDFKTKKKAYKLLALIVEKYDLENGISELVEIHTELTPIMEGQATKSRLRLVRAYIEQIKRFVAEKKEASLQAVGDLLKHYIIELVTAMGNTNLKIRELANGIFSDICTLMRVNFNAVNQLFTIILVCLAGNKHQTQSATIRSLLFAMKECVIFSKNQELFIQQ